MTQHEAWLTAVIVTGVIFIIIFWGIIPRQINSKQQGREAKLKAWQKATNWVAYFMLTCALATLIYSVISNNWLPSTISLGAFAATFLLTVLVIPSDGVDGDSSETYVGVTGFVAFYFLMLTLASTAPILAAQKEAEQNAEEAKYDQTVTYHIDSTSRKVDDGNATTPISNLRTNSDGDTYSWLERQTDGALQPRTVKRVNDGRYEVIIKDDLPATGTEARVERTVEYKVKSEDVNAGKEICDTTYSSSDPFINTLPKCEDGMTSARFQKAYTIIHIPAGSAEKMVPVTN